MSAAVGGRGGPSDDLSPWVLGRELGRGGFGTVFEALNAVTGESAAIKRVSLANVRGDELDGIESEVRLLSRLDHQNIVHYIGSRRSHCYLYIILELIEGGSLSSACRRFGSFSEPLVARFVAQMLRGLEYLGSSGVVHADIKAGNVLITKAGVCKLADFGVARSQDDVSFSGGGGGGNGGGGAKRRGRGVSVAQPPAALSTGANDAAQGSPYWMPPECIEMKGAPTVAADVWSLGATVVELLTGAPPFGDLQPLAAMYHIVTDPHMPLPPGITPALQDFLSRCFQRDPRMRASAVELLAHPWIVSNVAALVQRAAPEGGGALTSPSPAMPSAPSGPLLQSEAAAKRAGAAPVSSPSAAGAAATKPARPVVRSWLQSLKRGGRVLAPQQPAAVEQLGGGPPESSSPPSPPARHSRPRPAARSFGLGLGPSNRAEFDAIAMASLDATARQFQQQPPLEGRAPIAGEAATAAAATTVRALESFVDSDDDDLGGSAQSRARRAASALRPSAGLVLAATAATAATTTSRPLSAFVEVEGDDDLSFRGLVAAGGGHGASQRLRTSLAVSSSSESSSAESAPPPVPPAALPEAPLPHAAAGAPTPRRRGTHGHISLDLVPGDHPAGSSSSRLDDDWDAEPTATLPPSKGAGGGGGGSGGGGGEGSDDMAWVTQTGLSAPDLRSRLAQRLAGAGAPPGGGASSSAPRASHRVSGTALLGASSTGIDSLLLASSVDDGGRGSGGGTVGAAGWGGGSAGSGGTRAWGTALPPSSPGGGSEASDVLGVDPFAAFDERDFAVDAQAEALRAQQRRVEALAERISYDSAVRDPAGVRGACEELVALFAAAPSVRLHFLRSHGALQLIDTLQACAGAISRGGLLPRGGSSRSDEIAGRSDTPPAASAVVSGSEVLPLLLAVSWTLRVVNSLAGDASLLESLVLVGTLPAVLQFTAPSYPSPVRHQAAAFASQLVSGTRATLQVFVACGGVPVLIGLLSPSLLPSFSEEQLAAIMDDGGGGSTDATPTHGSVAAVSSSSSMAPASPLVHAAAHAAPAVRSQSDGSSSSSGSSAAASLLAPASREGAPPEAPRAAPARASTIAGLSGLPAGPPSVCTAASAVDALAAWEVSQSTRASPAAAATTTPAAMSAPLPLLPRRTLGTAAVAVGSPPRPRPRAASLEDDATATPLPASALVSSGSPPQPLRQPPPRAPSGTPLPAPPAVSCETIDLDDLLLLLQLHRASASSARRDALAASSADCRTGDPRQHASGGSAPAPAGGGTCGGRSGTSTPRDDRGSSSGGGAVATLRRRYGLDLVALQQRFVLEEAGLVRVATSGMLAVFSLQPAAAAAAPNEFRRLFLRGGLLKPLCRAVRSTFLYLCSQLTDALARGTEQQPAAPLLGYSFAGPPPFPLPHSHADDDSGRGGSSGSGHAPLAEGGWRGSSHSRSTPASVAGAAGSRRAPPLATTSTSADGGGGSGVRAAGASRGGGYSDDEFEPDDDVVQEEKEVEVGGSHHAAAAEDGAWPLKAADAAAVGASPPPAAPSSSSARERILTSPPPPHPRAAAGRQHGASAAGGGGSGGGGGGVAVVPRFTSPRSEASFGSASEASSVSPVCAPVHAHPGSDAAAAAAAVSGDAEAAAAAAATPAAASRAKSSARAVPRRGFFAIGSDTRVAGRSAPSFSVASPAAVAGGGMASHRVLTSAATALPPMGALLLAALGSLAGLADVLAALAQGDAATKVALAAPDAGLLTALLRLLRPAPYALLGEPRYAGVVLRVLTALRYVSMDPDALEALDACGAVGILVHLLTRHMHAPTPGAGGGHAGAAGAAAGGGRLPEPAELATTMHLLFNLLRVNKSRQLAAAAQGIVPALQRVIVCAPTLKPLAIPLLCDLAFAGAKARSALEEHAAADTLVALVLLEPYWHVHALSALATWCASSAGLCGVLARPGSLDALVHVFCASSTFIEAVLPPLLSIAERCGDVAGALAARDDFMRALCERLARPSASKAILMKHLLGLLRAVHAGCLDKPTLLRRWALRELLEHGVIQRVGEKAVLLALAQTVLASLAHSSA